MDFYTRYTSIDLMLNNHESIGEIAKNNMKSFTRNRVMNYYDMAMSIILKRGKTLTLELEEFMKKINKPKITKQAYSKQRKNLNPEIFVYLNNGYTKEIYKGIELKKYKEYLVLSVDGSIIELPNSKELKEYYGVQEGQKGSVGRVRARALGIYDSLNKIMLSTRIDPYNISEKGQVLSLLLELKDYMEDRKFIIVFDRYYFGIGFIEILEEIGIKYLIRMRLNDYKSEKNKMESNDEIIKMKVRSNSVFYAIGEIKEILKNKKYVETRVIKTKIPSGEEEHLCTNLSEEELNEKEAVELYYTRWNIEKAFDILKNKLNIENFSAKTVIGIEQEFYAQILVYNMLEDMRRDATGFIKVKANRKYEYKINMNILAGKFKNEYIDIVLIKDEKIRMEKYKKMLDEMASYLVPIKPGRKFPRKKMHSMNKYRSNLRRNV